jgi:hypothetical protein
MFIIATALTKADRLAIRNYITYLAIWWVERGKRAMDAARLEHFAAKWTHLGIA